MLKCGDIVVLEGKRFCYGESMNLSKRATKFVKRITATITGAYYYEDFIRVYPDNIKFTSKGKKRTTKPHEIKNFLSHRHFYLFASQFAEGRKVADVGCGSGYGCQILKEKGAESVHGYDLSKEAIEFAKARYGTFAAFGVQRITEMECPDDTYDLTVSSEVLEHVKEYGKQQEALSELKRITQKGGLIIIGTPNTEMIQDHGFSFDEIHRLFSLNFSRFIIFENALLPFINPEKWRARLKDKKTGVVVTQSIRLDETLVPDGARPVSKDGIAPGVIDFAGYRIDTTLLRNTHSWVAIGIKDG